MIVAGRVYSCTLRSASQRGLAVQSTKNLSTRSCFCWANSGRVIVGGSVQHVPVLQKNHDINNSVVVHAQRRYATIKGGYGVSRKVLKPVDEGFEEVLVEESMTKVGYEDIDALKDADEKVKRLFTLEYATNREVEIAKKSELRKRVRRHEDDIGSHEVQIAQLTLHIRNLANHMKNNKKDICQKRRLLEAIDRRNQLLGYLRRNYYDRFELVLKELGLKYSIPPSSVIKLTKKELERRSVTRKAYYDRKLAIYEFFKRKLDKSENAESEGNS